MRRGVEKGGNRVVQSPLKKGTLGGSPKAQTPLKHTLGFQCPQLRYDRP